MKTIRRTTSRETRARILAAAKHRFATDGYERTTIRAVATDAAIDPSMVMRYFKSKDKLFKTAMNVDLHFPDLRHLPRQKLGVAIVDHFLKLWESGPTAQHLRLVLRSSSTHQAAALRMHETFRNQVLPFVRLYCAPGQAKECAALVASQMMGLAYLRYTLQYPEVAALSQASIRKKVGATIQAYLDMR